MGCLLKANGLYSRTTIGAVLLAAGAGSRLGGRPKALLELGGVPLVLRQLIALQAAGVDEVALVLGHHAAAIEPVVAAFPITIVHNPTPDAGQATSVRAGLAALSPRLDAVIVALADQPLIDGPDVVALIAAFKKRPAGTALLAPRVRVVGANDGEGAARPGNPVIFGSELRDAWLAGAADLACRRWREAHPEQVAWFDTDNRRYALDIDTPEDLAHFAATTGHALAWPAAWREPAWPVLATA